MNFETRERIENTEEEKIGKQLIDELKNALETRDKENTLSVLKKVGETIHSTWGSTMPVSTLFDKFEKKYTLNLSTGTAGTRLFINDKPNSIHQGDLIFPNVNLSHKQKGKTLAEAFEEIFKDLAENIQTEENPYYIVKIASKKEKE